MRVYDRLNELDGYSDERKAELRNWLMQFENNRHSDNRTREIFRTIPKEERCDFVFAMIRIITDWDRLSFASLYLICHQFWNSQQGFIVTDVIEELRNLGANEKTIEYACSVDLENIEALYNAGDIDGLTQLLYYSEDCDDAEQQCSYKVKAENKIRRCLERLSFPCTSASSTTNGKADNANILNNPHAKALLDRLVTADILNSDYTLGSTNLSTAAVIADAISRECNISKKHKLFASLWNIKVNQLSDALQTAKRTSDKSNFRRVLAIMFVKTNSFGTMQEDTTKIDELMRSI